MGWLFMERPHKVKEYMDDIYSWSNENGNRKVIASGIVNIFTYYAAVEHIFPNGSRQVWAGVALLKFPRGETNFGYKSMDETQGPVETLCPEYILNLLTTTTSQNAQIWRIECRLNIKKRRAKPPLRHGVTIKILNPPVHNGFRLDKVTVIRQGRKLSFSHYQAGRFRWPSIRNYEYIEIKDVEKENDCEASKVS